MGAGRPWEIDRDEIKAKARVYLETDGYKTIADFCRVNKLDRKHFWRMCEADEELSHLRELIVLERECHLERGGLSGELNSSMAKFALAQIGWTEKQEIKQESVQINVSGEDKENLL